MAVALAETLSGFARALGRGAGLAEVLEDLSGRVTKALDITGAGVSLLEGDRLVGVASSGESAASLEQIQESHQRGPCVDASMTGRIVRVDDMQRDPDRWPEFARHARSAGIRSVVSIPMGLGEARIGAVDLYEAAPRRWSDEEIATARLLSDMAASYVVQAGELDRQRHTAVQLQHALDSRILIEQAKGMIAAQRGITVDEAFKVLRKHANDNNAQLHAVADAVVHLGLRP